MAAVDWKPCNPDPSQPDPKIYDCAVYQVPLDYDHPKGETTGIAMMRRRASDPAKRIGSLSSTPAARAAAVTCGRPPPASARTSRTASTWSASTRAVWPAATR